MAHYNYQCHDCEKIAFEQHHGKLTLGNDGELHLPVELYEELVLFETSHAMRPTKKELREATECPRCHGHNCTKTFHGTNVTGYVRGYGWLDRAGAKRDMHHHTLINNDPYGQYRVPGEVDHISSQLKKHGQRKANKKHFLGNNTDMEKAVTKAVSTPPPAND